MDNIFTSIYSMIEKDKLNSKEEFDLFISNLINHPTPLREACAFKLEELYDDCFLDENTLNIILASITDINPNVSRSICSVIKKNNKLKTMLTEKIIIKIKSVLEDIPQAQRNDNTKSHAKNKQLFALYWLLEALYFCALDEFEAEISKILSVTFKFSDYTIREKSAQLLTKLANPDCKLVDNLKSDNNFYVNFYAKFI